MHPRGFGAGGFDIFVVGAGVGAGVGVLVGGEFEDAVGEAPEEGAVVADEEQGAFPVVNPLAERDSEVMDPIRDPLEGIWIPTA